MALIKSYVHPEIGCTINLYDDACDCPQAEMAVRRAALEDTLRKLLSDPDLRQRLAELYAESDGGQV
jgi:hypothetical protein